ncbi:rhodanese-like domain-containing protein [Roseivirga sp.]|uniref:rhodanese-like domain-containing protein n=1 Tax=Roseivirga sp. TaxID=1964215 RepID=UPI003BAA5C06
MTKFETKSISALYLKKVDREEAKLNKMKEVTVKELNGLMASNADFKLIDVREQNEFEIAEIGGELIPMNSVPQNVDKFPKDKQVIVHCRSGKRSGDVINWLEANHGFENLYNLKGGILAWADEIDPSVQKY